jgi:hypothetical protein
MNLLSRSLWDREVWLPVVSISIVKCEENQSILKICSLLISVFSYSLIHWFVDSLIHWFIDSLIHSLIHWFIDSLIHWFIDSLIHSLIHSFIHPFIHWFIHSFIHSFIHNLLISFPHSFLFLHWQINETVHFNDERMCYEGAMDTLARGLRNWAKIHEDGTLETLLSNRYSSWSLILIVSHISLSNIYNGVWTLYSVCLLNKTLLKGERNRKEDWVERVHSRRVGRVGFATRRTHSSLWKAREVRTHLQSVHLESHCKQFFSN